MYDKPKSFFDPTENVFTFFLIVIAFFFLFLKTLNHVVESLFIVKPDSNRVHLVEKQGACFVIYRQDIEPIPCPPAEK
jgi:hypothetical protein